MANGIVAGLRNPKTTVLGILAALAAIINAIVFILDGDPATNPDWATVAATVATALGLLFARDADKTSAQSGAGRAFTLLLLVGVIGVLCMGMGGCSKVQVNAEYSQILDETAALSSTVADRAEANLLDPNCMTQALRWNARCWRLFQDARDGKAPPAAGAAANR